MVQSSPILEMSPSEQYCYYLEMREPTFYSRIPHIINYLTYDYIDQKTGLTEVKKLSVYARELYRVIKSIANDDGACWQNRDHLAELCGMSTGQVTKAKQELMQKFHQLDGKSLLIIESKTKNNYSGDNIIGKSIYHMSKIVNIWGYNNAYMKTRKFLKKGEAPSPHDGDMGAPSPHDGAHQGAPSPHDTNNNPINNNPLFKEQQPTANADSVVFLNHEERLSPSDQEKIYSHLVENGCKESVAKRISKCTSCNDYKNANEYMRQQMRKNKAKGKEIPNLWGYFQTILTNRYWEKK